MKPDHHHLRLTLTPTSKPDPEPDSDPDPAREADLRDPIPTPPRNAIRAPHNAQRQASQLSSVPILLPVCNTRLRLHCAHGRLDARPAFSATGGFLPTISEVVIRRNRMRRTSPPPNEDGSRRLAAGCASWVTGRREGFLRLPISYRIDPGKVNADDAGEAESVLTQLETWLG